MAYQSPISPGHSWYEATTGERPEYPALDGDRTCDVAIIGGGFTGLSAAAHLAKAGVETVLIDQARFGDGASGRNGGQMGTGQRSWPEDHEKELGFERAKALFDIAEDAKRHMLEFAEEHGIDIGYRPGQLSVIHRKRYADDYRRHAEIMAERYGYPHISYMDREETAERTGSSFFHGGIRDTGTGHIHPLRLVIGTARAAAAAGARLFENTKATGIARDGGRVRIATARGTITAGRALVAVNAYGSDTLEPVSAAHVMPIRSFIGATEPLPPELNARIIPGGESIDDSRFVVRYFRKYGDDRLLFGGREAYTADNPRDIAGHIRRQIAEIYPELADVGITHAWGGSVGITMPREPFVAEVMPGVTAIGGFSGHGVMLSNFTGRLYAEAVSGNRDRLEALRELKVPAFPGGRRFRKPLLTLALTWFAMLDRL
ncbi:NAD(P)/FAD-dependent oxidoreductase [Oricola thermophila]|uniref:FAD-binding oxidoreductase n=1 Tax=Oricola thermophila TaxID=2742145 RepID=A0A6N1VK34_9HYPH|nr:FAD-binding oxidoreductase [Oricola thermophila]QKV19287.1 FAD-binding oxidoreductase [Oricola thermophila]